MYERPRERLQRTGAASLTTVELLQVLIASGNSTVSSGRIAKNVSSLLELSLGTPSFEALLQVRGLGIAKACQLLAAIELGVRLLRQVNTETPTFDATKVRTGLKTTLYCRFHDATGTNTADFTVVLGNKVSDTVAVKRMFGEALANGARSLDLALGSKNQNLETLSTATLDVLHKVYDTAGLLEIHIRSVHLVNKTETKLFKKGALHGG